MSTTKKAGNWVHVVCTFTKGDLTALPTNTVLLANVTCRYRSNRASVDVDVTATTANVSSGVTAVAGVDNSFQVDVYVPDGSLAQAWQFHWESSTPHINIENDDLLLNVTASSLVTP